MKILSHFKFLVNPFIALKIDSLSASTVITYLKLKGDPLHDIKILKKFNPSMVFQHLNILCAIINKCYHFKKSDFKNEQTIP